MCKKSEEIDSFLDVHNDPRKKKTVDSLVDKGYVEISDALKRKVGDENVSMVRLSDEYVSGDTDHSYPEADPCGEAS